MVDVAQQTTTETQEEKQPSLEERLASLDTEQQQEESQVSTPEESKQPPQEVKEESKPSLPSLDELELPPQAESTQPQPEEVKPPQGEEYEKFAKDFREYLGFDIDELKAGMQELQQLREYETQRVAQQQQQQELESLRTEWGVDQSELDNRMNMILERFAKYPPEMQQRLDNLEGAKLIWAKLQQESEMSQQQVPAFQKSSGKTASGQQAMFTKSEIQSMSSSEYAKHADKILKAYQLGLVNLDA